MVHPSWFRAFGTRTPQRDETLHVVFSASAAGSLKVALEQMGRPPNAIALFDDLTLGPLAGGDEARVAAMSELTGYDWAEVIAGDAAFWEVALSWSGPVIVWTSRRSTFEWTGYLDWVWRAGDRSYSVIDLTDVHIDIRHDGVVRPPYLANLPLLTPVQISQSGMFDLAQPQSRTERQRATELWRRLREENAPIRRIVSGQLVSAPITAWDDLLLKFIERRWRKAAWLVGCALTDQWDESIYQMGDIVLFGRLRALAADGTIEMRGEPDGPRFSVRLPVTK